MLKAVFKTFSISYLVLAVMAYAQTASAQLAGTDTTPGSSCAGFPTGATRLTADAGGNGAQVTLVCNGTNWVQEGIMVLSKTGAAPSAGSSLGWLSDVTISSPSNGEILFYSGGAWTNGTGGSGSSLWQQNANDIYYSSGNVGINVTTPTSSLSVYSSNSSPVTWDVAQNIYNGAFGSSAVYNAVVGLDAVVESGATGAGFTEAYAVRGDAQGTNDAKRQNVYGVNGHVTVHDTDVGYALIATDEDTSTSGTVYGLYIDLDDTDVTRYGIYQFSSNTNYFAGSVGIGTTTPSAQSMLDVHGGGVFARHGTNPIYIEMDVIGNTDDSARVKIENDFTGGNEPDAALELDSTGNGESSVEFERDDARIWQIIAGDATTNRLRIEDGNDAAVITFESGGRVGIGNTTPGTILDVVGSSTNSTPIVEITQNTLNGEILEARNANNNVIYNFWLDDEGDAFLDFNNDAGDMQMQLRMSSDIILDIQNTGATPGDNDAILRLDSNSDGEQQIEFNYNGTNNWTIAGDDMVGGELRFEDAGGGHRVRFQSQGDYRFLDPLDNDYLGIRFDESDDIRLYLEASGSVGDVDAVMYLDSNDIGESRIWFNHEDTNYWQLLSGFDNGYNFQVLDGADNAIMTFSSASGGMVGINDANPSVALDVVGDINYTGVLVDVSDIRMKYDIEPLQSPLAKLTSLNGFSFKMKDGDSEITEYGVSAQDVQDVFPELVHEVDADGTLGVSYDGLIAPMIEAIKAQQSQIEALQAEISTLKQEIRSQDGAMQ